MTGRLSRILGALDRMLSFALGAILICIFSLNLYQVGGRYLFAVGAVWIPDLTRLLFIWMVFLGTALMHQRKRHLAIDVLLLKFPGRARRTIEALIAVGMLGLAGVMAAVGWRIMQIRMDIPYTGLEIPTGYAYLAVPVAAALIALSSLVSLWAWTRASKRRVDAGAR